MSTPSVWGAGGVRGDPLSLDDLMTFVMLHEGSHVVQSPTYGRRIGAIAERYGLPDSINDDTMQHDFGSIAEFSASVQRETDLLLQASNAADDAEALGLAREARDLMRARAVRFFTGEYEHYNQLEDVWLTFEGSGQWAGYGWVTHPQGLNLDHDLARRAAMRSRWWSQNEGLALALALDRLGPEGWQRVAFGDGARTLVEMLDERLGQAEPSLRD
jgi:hypothetical protein